jgi:hypothetical protein
MHDFKSNRCVRNPLITKTNFDFLQSPSVEFMSLSFVLSSCNTVSRSVRNLLLKLVINLLSISDKVVFSSSLRSLKQDLCICWSFITSCLQYFIASIPLLSSDCLSSKVGLPSKPHRLMSHSLELMAALIFFPSIHIL